MEKSTLQPNVAALWVNCPASVQLAKNYPPLPENEERTQAKKEGRAFHELSELMLASKSTNFPDLVGAMSSHGVAYDDEMYECAQFYANDVMSTAEKINAQYRVESRVNMPSIIEGMYGYCDASIFSGSDKELIVYDVKYGFRYVDAFENWQLLTYAFAKCKNMQLTPETSPNLKIVMKVIQPRSYHSDGPVRSWVITLSELYETYGPKIVERARESQEPSARCIVGAHCGGCGRAHVCGALGATVYSGMDDLADRSGLLLSGRDLSLEYSKLKAFESMVKSRIDGLEAQLIHELQNGVIGTGYALEQKYGNKAWCVSRDEVITLGEMYGIKVTKDDMPPLITPTQMMKKGVDESVIIAYSSRPKTGIKLVEVTSAKMRKIFTREGN